MNRNTLKVSLVGLLLMASLLACLAIRRASREKLGARDAQLAAQAQRIDALRADNARLAKISRAPDAATTATPDELLRLRAEVQLLKQQVATAEQQARAASQAAATKAKEPVQHPDEYWTQLRARAEGSLSDAIRLVPALMEYARNHGGQFPASLDQAGQYFPQGLDPDAARKFEIVYTGTMDAVKDAPGAEVPLVRQRQAWLGPDGTKLERVYGFVGGMCQTIESDDNFQSWEAEHLINATGAAKSNPQ